MDVTRTAIVSSDFMGRIKDKDDAIALAKELDAQVCSLRYIGNHLDCTFGFAIYQKDTILGLNPDEYKWI